MLSMLSIFDVAPPLDATWLRCAGAADALVHPHTLPSSLHRLASWACVLAGVAALSGGAGGLRELAALALGRLPPGAWRALPLPLAVRLKVGRRAGVGRQAWVGGQRGGEWGGGGRPANGQGRAARWRVFSACDRADPCPPLQSWTSHRVELPELSTQPLPPLPSLVPKGLHKQAHQAVHTS